MTIAAISIMRPRPDISAEQFRRHWIDPHGVMTAELPRLRRYVQSHCIEHPAVNELARSLGIGGFPELWFDSLEDRRIAYTSKRIAECNVDSEHFIGAVCRLVTEPLGLATAPLKAAPGEAKAILLAVGEDDAAWPGEVELFLRALPGARSVLAHRLLEQAAAPNSRIPELKIAVAGIAETVFESDAALAAASLALTGWRRQTAVFAVEDVIFC
jgi:uncharacterized protein (TIGR02118 family)